MEQQDTQTALVGASSLPFADKLLDTMTALAAGLITTGSFLSSRLFGNAASSDKAHAAQIILDAAIELHLAVSKPPDVLLAEYQARKAKDTAQWDDRSHGLGLLLGVPGDALKAVGGDYDKLDKAALSKLGEFDRHYSGQRAAVYQQLVAGAGAGAVDVNLPRVA